MNAEQELLFLVENLNVMLQRLQLRNEDQHDPSFRGYLPTVPLLKECLDVTPTVRTVALKVLSAMVDCRCSSIRSQDGRINDDDCVRLHQRRLFVQDVIHAVAAADIVPVLVRILLEKQVEETCMHAARAMVGMMIGGRAEQRQELVLQCTRLNLWCSAVDRLNMALEEDYGAAEDLRADYEAVRRRIQEETQAAQDSAPWFDRGHFLTGFSPLYRDVPTIEDGLDAPDRCRSGGAAVWPARERVCGSGGGGGR